MPTQRLPMVACDREDFQARAIKPAEADGHEPGQLPGVALKQLPLLVERLAVDVLPEAGHLDGQEAEREKDDDGDEEDGAIDQERDAAKEKGGGGYRPRFRGSSLRGRRGLNRHADDVARAASAARASVRRIRAREAIRAGRAPAAAMESAPRRDGRHNRGPRRAAATRSGRARGPRT